MTKRNQPIIVCVACQLAGLALVCMSMVPFVQAAASVAGAVAPATVDVHRPVLHCDKTQSQMGDRLARTLEENEGERFKNLLKACLRTVDECTDCCVLTVKQQGLTVANFATSRPGIPATPCDELVPPHKTSSATVSSSSSSLTPSDAAGRCKFPQRTGCDDVMYWSSIRTKTAYSRHTHRHPADKTTDGSAERIITKVLELVRHAVAARDKRTEIAFDAFEGPTAGNEGDKLAFALTVIVETGPGGSVLTGSVDMIAAQECCSGNEILDLIDCIFRELNVQWVDLLDGSHANCKGFTREVAAEVCTMGRSDTSALGQACDILTSRIRNHLLPMAFSYAVKSTSDRYESWYESKGYRFIGMSERPEPWEPYDAAKRAFFEMPFADLDAVTRCFHWGSHGGRLVSNLHTVAVEWNFVSHAASEITSLFDGTTAATRDTVHGAFHRAYAKIEHEFASDNPRDKEAAVKHCAALGVYVRTFWGRDIFVRQMETPDDPWCTEANVRHLKSLNLASEGHRNAREFLNNYAIGNAFRKHR